MTLLSVNKEGYMIVYDVATTRSGETFIQESQQFPAITGYGRSENDAFSDFMKKLYDEFKRIIRANERFPKPLEQQEIKAREDTQIDRSFFGIPTPLAIKMLLHTVMLNKGVNRAQLAKLLAITHDEVKDDLWELEKLLQLDIKNPPKYKKVQRLLDIEHDSTLIEIQEAFRVLDHNIDVVIRPKSLVHWEPVVNL